MSDMFSEEFKEETEVAVAEKPKTKRGRKAKKKVEKVEKETNLDKIKKADKISEKEKLIKSLMKKARITEFPECSSLFKNSTGTKVKLRDIAVFISDRTDIFKELADEMKLRNTLNLAAKIDLNRVKKIAQQILEDGHVYMAIECAQLEDGSKQLECWSGRHRLIALGLLYGSDVEIPVRITSYTTYQAREATLVANEARKTLMHEKAQSSFHKVLKKEDEKDNREVIYERMATNKRKAIHFILVNVLDLKVYGATLKFELSENSSRATGGLTTVNSLKGYYNNAIEWSKSMTFKEVDVLIKDTTKFLNEVVNELKHQEGFDSKQQLAAQPLKALGSLYTKLAEDISGAVEINPSSYAGVVAKSLIEMGKIGRDRSEDILRNLKKRVKKALSES